MNMAGLLTWLANQTWCDHVGKWEFISNDGEGALWYRVFVREVYEDSAISRGIHFYVVNEGTPDERAYWKDATPTATLAPQQPATPTYKMITFRTILNAMGAEAYTPMRLRIAAAAQQSLVLADVVKMLETYGPDGGIDINSSNTQATIQSLVATNVLTQAEAAAVIGLADSVIA